MTVEPNIMTTYPNMLIPSFYLKSIQWGGMGEGVMQALKSHTKAFTRVLTRFDTTQHFRKGYIFES